MLKAVHEIRDPIHTFVRMDAEEKKVVNSRYFQRLRHIHQLAMTHLVYPGATHTRFEHSLGVMELATRVFDVVTNPNNIHHSVKDLLPEIADDRRRSYWRQVIRVAALCHDLGHLPFSHAAEKELLPSEYDHETITRLIIETEEMKEIWNGITPPLRTDDIVRIALGPKKASDLSFSDGQSVISEIIVGDSFGVDRVDYLLRDSYYAGVAYGKFDHYRLIDTMRILPPPSQPSDDESREPLLGIEEGGIHTAEALALARYFMFTQVYCHHVRRIYDIHLKDFLKEYLQNGQFPTEPCEYLNITDEEIYSAIRNAARKEVKPGHTHAKRIINRDHYRKVYAVNPEDAEISPFAIESIYSRLCSEFGEDHIRKDKYSKGGQIDDFPVLSDDGRIMSSLSCSRTLSQLPSTNIGFIFVNPSIRDDVINWIEKNREEILQFQMEEE